MLFRAVPTPVSIENPKLIPSLEVRINEVVSRDR